MARLRRRRRDEPAVSGGGVRGAHREPIASSVCGSSSHSLSFALTLDGMQQHVVFSMTDSPAAVAKRFADRFGLRDSDEGLLRHRL